MKKNLTPLKASLFAGLLGFALMAFAATLNSAPPAPAPVPGLSVLEKTRAIQRAVGQRDDGNIGPLTVDAIYQRLVVQPRERIQAREVSGKGLPPPSGAVPSLPRLPAQP